MLVSASPGSKSGTATPAEEASGYLLLTIEHAEVKQLFDEETMTLARGEFRLECVSLSIPAEIGRQTANPFSRSPSDPPIPTHDFWLVIKVGPTFEMPLIPTQLLRPSSTSTGTIKGQDGEVVYAAESPHVPGASVLFKLPTPRSQADLEDLDSFEILLRQYGSLGAESTALSNINPASFQSPSSNSAAASRGPPAGSGTASPPLAPEELRGQIVLINEDNGEVVGQFDQQIDLEEDAKLAGEDKNKPVVLDFGHLREGQDALRVKVKAVPEEDLDDWLLRGAHNISKGILSFGSWSSRQMLSGADRYIKTSTPRPEPVHFSPQTKEGFVKFHSGTVKVATVTKSTVGKIHNAISNVAEKTYVHGVQPAVSAYRRGSTPGAPPLPPRSPHSAPIPMKSPGTAPPVPSKPAHLHAPPSPQNTYGYNMGVSPTAYSPSSNRAQTVAVPTQAETLLASEERYQYQNPPSYSEKFSAEPGMIRVAPPPVPPRKKKLLGRLLLAGEVVLTSLEATAHDLINNGTIAASSAAGHKYGPDAGQATALVGGSVKNVAVVYIDVAGVGRRAILKSTAKGFVRAKLKDGETVQLQAEGHGQDIKPGEVDVKREGAEIVVGMPEIESSAVSSGVNTPNSRGVGAGAGVGSGIGVPSRENDAYRRR
ncbi:hypothetical protein I316_01391 [Kwoniella heveanensis BCC8398]|uniref:Senescence domain-containing protein n=1 Tax=Kwoniella heveanensis BCC8398 TaxID=1296120 RepID=A0A1B9H0K4_9TREE|nr:hypothetical protein I316_01391 [Kwoniella heveanensis BCC8398]